MTIRFFSINSQLLLSAWISTFLFSAGVATGNIQKKCRPTFIEICGTGKSDINCCVVGGERCCSDDEFNEDRRKLVAKILKDEKKARENVESSSDFPIGDFSSDNRWKTGMIICVAIIITACLFCCIADLLFNICTCFQRCSPLLYDHKERNKNAEVEVDIDQVDESSNKRVSGYTSSNLIQESVIPEEIQMEEGSDTSERSAARDIRNAVVKELSSVSSSPENRPDKSLTLTKRELQLLRSECFKLFNENEKLNLSLQEPTFESQSTNNLSPSKRIRKCSENNERNCQSCRTSPVLTERKAQSTMNNQMRIATLNRLGGAIPKSSSLKFSTLQPANRDFDRGQSRNLQQHHFVDFDEHEQQIAIDNRGHGGLLVTGGPRSGSSHHVISPLALSEVPSSVAKVNFHSLSPSRECMEADC